VQLPEVHVIDTEPVEGPVQFVARLLFSAGIGFGSQEEASGLPLQPWTNAQLRLAVARRGVDVVDGVAKQHLKGSIGDLLADPREGRRAKEGAAALVPRAPEVFDGDRHL
jgi:hypothetical protein